MATSTAVCPGASTTASATATGSVAVQAAVAAQVDGRTVPLTLVTHTYPPADLLAAAGGTITLERTSGLPADAHQVSFVDRCGTGPPCS